MRLFLAILIFACRGVCSYHLLKQIFESALVGDFLSTLPARLQCVGAGRNFTRFLLYNRLHPDHPRPLVADDTQLLQDSDFDPHVPTKVIVHGFVDNMRISDWMQKMKSKFLSTGDYNVILVDWSCGNEFPYYQAIQNSKITANELTRLLSFLQVSTAVRPQSFHLIAHSLGSHIAALVGHAVTHLGRISALDPAGPRFYDAPLEERLDPTDALFVDAIHTDAGHGLLQGLGLRAQVGHVDFYPNGGRDQPGCHSSPFTILPRIGIHRAARYYLTCDHIRSVEYYIDSISGSRKSSGAICEHIGVACRDWETYEQGRCADCSHPGDCALMGYFSDLYYASEEVTQHEYYVKTAEEEPFCVFQYQVVVELECDPGFCQDHSISGSNHGPIRLELRSRGGKTIRLDQDDTSVGYALKPGGQYVYLATSRFSAGAPQDAKIWWGGDAKPHSAASEVSTLSDLHLRRIEVITIDLHDPHQRLSSPALTVLCGFRNRTITQNHYIELGVNNC